MTTSYQNSGEPIDTAAIAADPRTIRLNRGGPVDSGSPALVGNLPRVQRRLNWGPFTVGATVTLIAATLLGFAVWALGNHWYSVLLAVVGGLGVLLLGASAVGVLVKNRRA